MSDMSEGPGWWIASDGKWYPPHLHPSVRVDEEPVTSEARDTVTESGSATSAPGSGPESSDAGDAASDGHTASSADSASSADTASPVDTASSGPVSSGPAPRFVGSGDGSADVEHGAGTDRAEGDGVPSGPPLAATRSRPPLAAAVSVVIVVLLVVAAVVVFGRSESASAKVVNAVNSTLENGTAHVTMTVSGQAAGTSVAGTGTGGIDFTTNALQLQMEVTADGQQVPVNAVYLGGVVYESVPGLSTVAPGKTWLSIDLSALQKAESQSPSTQSLGDNPTVMLQMLAQQGNTVVPLGPSTVDGVAVNGYSVTVDPSSVARQLKNADLPAWMQQAVSGLKVNNIGIKVYIDTSGLLRSFVMQTTETTAAGTSSIDETIDLSDYGTAVDVSAPPADQVETFQQLLQAAGTSTGAAGSTAPSTVTPGAAST